MLEYWYQEKRTLANFRRGLLGPHFDGFAAYLKAEGLSRDGARRNLPKISQFNRFLIDRGIRRFSEITGSLVDCFLDGYGIACTRGGESLCPRNKVRRALRHLFRYLRETGVLSFPKPTKIRTLYSWILDPYLQHLRDDCQLDLVTTRQRKVLIESFLKTLHRKASRKGLKTLSPGAVEIYIKKHIKDGAKNLGRFVAALRSFFHYCALHKYTSTDFSGLIPRIHRYRLATLPRGMDDSALQRVLKSINTKTPIGARNYAIIALMIAYGLRGTSVTKLLLDDIDWQNSRIRIRAQKGGKEVVLPLMAAIGDAIIRYLPHRFSDTPLRVLFLTARAPARPLSSTGLSHIVHAYMKKAGIKTEGHGLSTLRHSWAIRTLTHDSSIKSIADVLGHRCINTTFIYAKADLKTLRQVALPWPERG